MEKAMMRKEWLDEGSQSAPSSSKIKGGSGLRPKPILEAGEWKYEVERVLDEDTEEKKVLVKWVGYSHATWQPMENVPNIFIETYRNRHLYLSARMMKKRHVKPGDTMVYRYKGVPVKVDDIQENFVCNGIRDLANDVILGLKDRFPSDSHSILSSFDIFHLESMPTGSDAQQKWDEVKDEYGHHELGLLIDHYSQKGIDDEPLLKSKPPNTHAEWRMVRQQMWAAKVAMKSTDEFWEGFLLQASPHRWPNICLLATVFLLVVLTSASCERVFSAMNRTKTSWRCRMKSMLLECLLMIKLNGPECWDKLSIETLIERVWQVWNGRKRRLPKRSRTDSRPGRKKKEKSGVEAIKLDRPQVFSDSDDDGCVCCRDEEDGENGDDTDSRRIAARYHVFDDMSSFMPRVPLVPEKGWYPLTLDKVEGKDKSSVMSAMESDTRKLRIEIQFRDGWHSAGWITQFTDKVCAEHSQNYKGWVWVSVVFEGEATQQYYLCDLDDTMYGMDSHSSWCVLKRNQ